MNRRMLQIFYSAFPVVAFAAAGIACNDALVIPPDNKVTSVAITPQSIVMNVGDKLTLVATVTAGPDQSNLGVRWATGNAAVASISESGLLTSNRVGTAVITATALADTTIKGSAMVDVASFGLDWVISALNQGGTAADLRNVAGQLDVVVAFDGDSGDLTRFDLLLNCGAVDTVVAAHSVAADERSSGTVTLSFNTAGFKNGQCSLWVRAVMATGAVEKSATLLITLNNPNPASATVVRTWRAGGRAVIGQQIRGS